MAGRLGQDVSLVFLEPSSFVFFVHFYMLLPSRSVALHGMLLKKKKSQLFPSFVIPLETPTCRYLDTVNKKNIVITYPSEKYN